MNKIADSLFFGGLREAADTESYHLHRIDVVVRLCEAEPVVGYPDNVEVFDRYFMDGDAMRPCNLAEAVTVVDKKANQGNNVFVHCTNGESRSPAVVAACIRRNSDDGVDNIISLIREEADQEIDISDNVLLHSKFI